MHKMKKAARQALVVRVEKSIKHDRDMAVPLMLRGLAQAATTYYNKFRPVGK